MLKEYGMIRNTTDVSINDVQGYLTKGAKVHPLLYTAFLNELIELQYKRILSILPQTRLEIYSKRVSANIARRIAA